MKLETTFRHAYVRRTRLRCPPNSFTKRSERRLERRLANKFACDEATFDVPITCATCSTIVDEGERYCPYCKSYWQDIKNGLYEERN